MFSVRDLLIVAALIVGGTVVAYRSTIEEYCKPAVEPVQYYVDAPAREAELLAQIDRLCEQVRIGQELEEKASSELRDAQCVIDAYKSETDRLDAELAKLRSRYAALCQRLVQLGNDVPPVLAGE